MEEKNEVVINTANPKKENRFDTKTTLIIVATLILAGIAIFTAVRLYQLRQEAVAPTAPTSEPAAKDTCGPDKCKDKHLLQVGCESDGTKNEQLCDKDRHTECRKEYCDGVLYYCVPSNDKGAYAWSTEDNDLCLATATPTESPTATATPTLAATSSATASPTEASVATPTPTQELLDSGVSSTTILSGGLGLAIIAASLLLLF